MHFIAAVGGETQGVGADLYMIPEGNVIEDELIRGCTMMHLSNEKIRIAYYHTHMNNKEST